MLRSVWHSTVCHPPAQLPPPHVTLQGCCHHRAVCGYPGDCSRASKEKKISLETFLVVSLYDDAS